MTQLKLIERYLNRYHKGLNPFLFNIQIRTLSGQVRGIDLYYNRNTANENQIRHAHSHFGSQGRFTVLEGKKAFVSELGRLRLIVWQESPKLTKKQIREAQEYREAMRRTAGMFTWMPNTITEG